jgi:hypothetical protein
MNLRFPTVFLFAMILLSACWKAETQAPKREPFSADRAYAHVITQEKIGPRFVGSEGHKKMHAWLITELKSYGLSPRIQTGVMGESNTPIKNVLVSTAPKASRRVLLSAHYDTRPFADEDPIAANRKSPILGANDGGSGVAVLLELARISAGMKDSDVGIDFAFWDAEDLGLPHDAESYCLGSQYFALHPDFLFGRPEYGVNLDMVGRKGSVFPMERFSEQQAAPVFQKIRAAAKVVGADSLFAGYRVGPITDDHVFIARGLKIPMVDLIYVTEDGRFAPEWHTLKDTSEYISRDVLGGVGQTLLEMLR